MSGGGLTNYQHNQQFTNRSMLSSNKFSMKELPEGVSSTSRDHPILEQFEVNTPNRSLKDVGNTSRGRDMMNNLLKDITANPKQTPRMNDTSRLIMDMNQVKDELLSGGISNVVLHPQDMKRIGLIEESQQQAKVNLPKKVDIERYQS